MVCPHEHRRFVRYGKDKQGSYLVYVCLAPKCGAYLMRRLRDSKK